jgi:hypothetical protein
MASKRTAVWIVCAYFVVFFGAVLLRVDYYPFTWVPMYGHRDTEPVLVVTVGDLAKRREGFRATQADGQVDYISREDLNMPRPNFRRLYAERMFGEGPPQFRRERLALSPFNRWWYDHLVGPLDIPDGMYQEQVLNSINRTLGRDPGDADYIVRIEAEVGQIRLTREQRRSGEFSALHKTDLVSTVTPDGVRIAAMAPGSGQQQAH